MTHQRAPFPGRFSISLCTLFMLACLTIPALAAQNPQAESQAEPTISSTTELVLVPAQVKGHDGKPLLGLKQHDFIVRSDGKAQPIRLFDETTHKTASAPPRNPTPVPANMVLSVPNGGMPDQILIVALDLVNTTFLDQTRARQELSKFLAQQLPNQHFALVAITKNGLVQVQSFSSDPAVLIDALKRLQSSTAKDVTEAPPYDRLPSADAVSNAGAGGDAASGSDPYAILLKFYKETQIYGAFAQKIAVRATLTALTQIAQAYAGVPGRKSVIWITAGMPTLIFDAFAGGAKGNGVLNGDPELLSDYDAAFRALNNANVAIYGVDIKGLKLNRTYEATGIDQSLPVQATVASLYGPGLTIQPGDYQDDAIKVISSATGGKSCTANSGLKDCIDQALADNSSYYMLGFYVPQQERKAGWHKLEVKLTSERGSVRARTSYYLAPTTAPSEKQVNRALRDAAYAQIGYTGLAFAVQREAPDASKPDAAGMRIFLPARSILMTPGHPQLSYDIISIPLDDKREPTANLRVVHLNFTAEQTQSALNKGWSYVDQPDGGGKLPVKYVLRDNGTGRIGSVIVPPQKAGG